ncbi:MAG: hypothetical protein VX078_07260 [Pseudomonadota bacterium]|nr:hypothetical protein [Pseudomonadota bacterium]
MNYKILNDQFNNMLTSESANILKYVEFNSSPFKHPLDYEEIKESLLGSYDISLAKDYFAYTKDSTLSRFLQDIKKLFVNSPYVPNEDYFLDSVYVDYSDGSSNIVKIEAAVNQILNTKSVSAIIKGDRGSGKTASTLVYLYRNHEELFEKNIIWLRCDLHKLYNAWMISDSGLDNLITLGEYKELFIVYSICKHANDSERKEIYELVKLIKRNDREFGIVAKAKHTYLTDVSLYEQIQKTNEDIIRFEGPDSSRSFLLDEWIKHAQFKQNESRRQIKNARYLYNALLESINTLNWQLLLFFDGCDNVDINKRRNFFLYQKFLSELHPQLYRDTKNSPVYTVVLLRPRTYEELLEKHPNVLQDHKDSIPFVATLRTPCCEAVTNERFKYIRKIGLLNNLHDETHYRSISKAITTMLEQIKEDPSSLRRRQAINHNIRDFLFNRLSLISVLAYVSGINGKIKENHENYINPDSWNKRNKFLNGRLFSDSKTEGIATAEPGSIYFNIFFAKPNGNKWNGFIFLRIYQVLKRLSTALESECTTILSTLFDYDNDLVKESLEICETYGLIHFLPKSNENEDSEQYVVLNEKFNYLIEETFKDADVMYYLALDTYLPSALIESEYFRAHNNNVNEKSHYNEVMPFTATLFMKFLCIQDKLEREGLHGKLTTLIEKMQHLSIDDTDFVLPIKQVQGQIPVFKRIITSIGHTSEQKRREFNKIIES